MTKHEIRVELKNSEGIKKLIQNAYFKDGDMGKIMGNEHYLPIDHSDDINYAIFKDLNGATVRVVNAEVIDGTMRFMVDESGGDVKLYPISIYAIEEGGKYIFY